MSFTVKSDIHDLERLLDGLQFVPQGLAIAAMRAANKTAQGGRTDAVAMLRHDYNMKAGDIRSAIKIRKASKSRPHAILHGAGSPGIPLIRFRRGGTKVPSTRRLQGGRYSPAGGVSVLVRKDRGKKVVKGAFVARMKSGHIGLFQRRTDRWDSKIDERYGPSPFLVLSGDRYNGELQERISERWDKNIEHEADFVLKKAGLR